MSSTPPSPCPTGRILPPHRPLDWAGLCLGLLLSLMAAATEVRARSDEAAATRIDDPPPLANRLRVGTVMQFDARTRTVGDAIGSLLGPVRYRLTDRTVDAATSAALLRRPLPPAARDAGYMTIEQGLLLLIGEEHRLVVDHRNRLLALERMPDPSALPHP